MASTVWRGHLTFGLISIPVRLFRAARAERIPLKRVARSGSLAQSRQELPAAESGLPLGVREIASREAGLPENLSMDQTSSARAAAVGPDPLVAVRQSNRSMGSGVEVPESAITRAVEVQKNRFVEIPTDELKKLKAATSPDIAIQEFVPLSEIDPLYFETSYYVLPEEVGGKAYALLYKALVSTNVVALAELSMHGRDHVVVIRPGQTGLVAHTMFYVSEVHLDEQFQADTQRVEPKELDLAKMLVSSLTTSFEPERYKNGYHQKLQDLIENRVSAAREPTVVMQEAASGGVVDIADALRKSLAQLKKPAQKSVKTVSDIRQLPKTKIAVRG